MTLYLISNITLLLVSDTYYHLRPSYSLEQEKDSCYSCHTSLVMEKKNFLPVILERNSVHYKNNIFCSDCHKEEKFIMKNILTNRDKIFSVCPFYKTPKKDRHKINSICGSCHKKEYEDFTSGVHKNKLECLYCHSNHGIRKASLDIIRPDKCSLCHRYPDIAPVKDEFRKAETILLASESYLNKYSRDIPDLYQKFIQKINLARENMRIQRHRFSKTEITSNSNYILLLSGHIRKEITTELDRIKVKRLILIGIMLIIFLAIIGILYYLYQYLKWRRTLNINKKNNY